MARWPQLFLRLRLGDEMESLLFDLIASRVGGGRSSGIGDCMASRIFSVELRSPDSVIVCELRSILVFLNREDGCLLFSY
jgi:hypothetical protein